MQRHAIVLSGGLPAHPGIRPYLPAGAYVVAADSGYRDAAPLGLRVDVLVGDLDSITEGDLHDANRRGIPIDRHPVDKDATDLELAMAAARAHGCAQATVISGGGGRLDHLLGGIALLGASAYADLRLDAWIGTAHVLVLHGPGAARVGDLTPARPGDLLTLLAVGGPATGITTRGLRFPLAGETLVPGETRGLSNQFSDKPAEVHVETGTLLIIRPDAAGAAA